MSEVTISLPPPPIPKPLPPTSPSSPSPSAAIPARPHPPPSAITKPLPPPVVTSASKGSREKLRFQKARHRCSPPTLPPPAPPTISPSPPPYSSISPPPSPILPAESAPPTDTRQRTPPPRPPPPSIIPPSAPPTSVATPSATPTQFATPPAPPNPSTLDSTSRPLPPPATNPSPGSSPSLPPHTQPIIGDEVAGVNGGVDDSGRGEEGEGGEEEEEHYEKAPISQAAAASLKLDGEKGDSGPEYVNVDSLDEEEEEEEEEGEQGEEGEEGEGEESDGEREREQGQQSSRHSVIRQDYQNWDFLGQSDSEESDDDNNHTPRPAHHHHKPTQRNPPTLPLNTHPVLMAQMSRGSKRKGGKGVKRRNRAPPPPPGGRKGGVKLGAAGQETGRKEGREKKKKRVEEGRRREEREEEGEMRTGAEGEGEEHDYSTIPRTNYINWEFEQGTGSDSDDNSTPRPKAARPSNPPTLPLNTHPILMRSQSQANAVEPTDDTGADGRRPRNRAPPPPPTKTKSKPPRGFTHQLSHQPLSTPPPQPASEQTHGRNGGEYARVTKPPPAYKRTKSDQKPVGDGSDKRPGSPREREKGAKEKQHSPKQQPAANGPGRTTPPQQQSARLGGAVPSPLQKSPLATRKNAAEATPPVDSRGKVSGYGSGGEKEGVTRRGGRGGEGAPPSRPPPRAPPTAAVAAAAKKKRLSAAADSDGEGRVREKESPLLTNLWRRESSGAAEHLSRPKRQAPPPPVGRLTSVDQSQDHTGRESPQGAETPAEKLAGDTKPENYLQTPPPKPKRLHRRTPPIAVDAVVMATEASPTTQESTECEGRQTSSSGTPRAENGQGLDRWERLLHKMEFFTIDLVKEGDRSLGMVIVSGKVRNKDGTAVEGIFIQKILPGSLTDKDGRIQAGDMLVEINSTAMVGATVEVASRKLRESKESVKLKVGRPDIGAFKVPGENATEPIYVNSDDMEDSDLQAKLEKAEAKAKKMEELQEKAENELKVIREMAEKEQKTFHRKLEESEAEKAAYKKDTQAKITDLTVALANITVDKTKLEKEVETLKVTQSSGGSGQQDEELTRLKRELKEAESEREMAERHLKELRQEVEGSDGLQSRLAELESDLAQARQERETGRRQLESTCHELTVAHATLEQMQLEKTAMREENERLSGELERGRRPSAGRAGVESELALKRKDLQTAREERERSEREAGEARRELEREKERSAELESKLESQQKAEKSATSELLSRIESQAQQIHNLKKELTEAKAQGPVVVAKAVAPLAAEKEGEVERGGEGGDSGVETKMKFAAGVKQRSLDIELTPEHKRAHSPVSSQRSRTSSANKESPDKNSSPAKESKSSPQRLKDKPHDDSISIEAFDTIKPLEVLDHTLAKDKTQVALRNAKRARNKPSREHIRSMSAENLLSDLDYLAPDSSSSPTERLPVPRPRKATLEKDSPSHKPLPVPRHLRSPAPLQNESPLPQRPPKPDSGPGSPDRKGRLGGRLSPPHTRAPSPKPLLPLPAKSSGLPPKPAPRRVQRQGEDPAIEETPTKDPSLLTVKERMELAHKAMKKPPPVVPKKPTPSRSAVTEGDVGPKSLSQPEGEEASELPGTRYSVDSTHSPRPMKKLPPGAFNMGLFPMAPFGPARHRSNTTAPGSSREQSQDREFVEEDEMAGKMEEIDSGSKEALDVDDIELKFPPKRPPLPLTRRTASNEKPAQLSSRTEDVPLESAPPPVGVATSDSGGGAEGHTEETEVRGHREHGTLPDPMTLDYSQVLGWSPAQVAAWVTHIGASQHAKGFLDKGVQGNKLFDVDSSELKAMGVSSADDRALIKREIKALRQQAEKQRKVLEKQRKDDKKKKKRQFV